MAGWPQSLTTTVSICLASDLPICVIWGRGREQLYNDAYRLICGDKPPRSMAQNFAECWEEAWPVIGEAHDAALAGDKAFLETQHMVLERPGFLEECFFTFFFSPIRDQIGQVGGLFHPVIQMTTQMLAQRRTRVLAISLLGRAKPSRSPTFWPCRCRLWPSTNPTCCDLQVSAVTIAVVNASAFENERRRARR